MIRFVVCAVIFLGFYFSPLCQPSSFADNQKLTKDIGKTFPVISKDLIRRLEEYYLRNRQYAPQEGAKRFEDIGLNPTFWEGRDFGGIVYDPKGDTLEVRPAEEYTFFVNETSGVTRILSYNLHWSLIYNLKDKKWYFGTVSPDETVNIKALHIKKDTPYNPTEYRK